MFLVDDGDVLEGDHVLNCSLLHFAVPFRIPLHISHSDKDLPEVILLKRHKQFVPLLVSSVPEDTSFAFIEDCFVVTDVAEVL